MTAWTNASVALSSLFRARPVAIHARNVLSVSAGMRL
jgi:hypothetical protein